MQKDFAREVLNRLPLADAILSLWQWIADPTVLNDLFDRHSGRCYENLLTFPAIVQLISDALVKHRGSGRKSFAKNRAAKLLIVSDQAAYKKLGRLPVPLSEGFLAELTQRMIEVAPLTAQWEMPPSLRLFRAIVVDGKVVKRVPKRLKPLRGKKGGMLGGKALVAFDLTRGLALRMAAHPDGDVNDARLIPELVPGVRSQLQGEILLWIADRQFADLNQTEAFLEEGHHYLLRYHKRVTFTADSTRPKRQGQDENGRAWSEEWGWLGRNDHAKRRYVRRITLHRSGEEDIILITDLLDETAYPANDLLAAYLARWGIERVFQKITEVFHLDALIGTTPQGTLFQLSFCLVLYNLIQIVRGYVAEAAQRPVETISTELMFEDVRAELSAVTTVLPVEITIGLIKPVLTAAAMRERLRKLLANVWRKSWTKAPKQTRPRQTHSGKRSHSSVHRILQNEKPLKKTSARQSK
jgi:hypothetical protein